MREVIVTKYMADDGSVFDTEKACKEYESNIKEAKSLKRALRRVKVMCEIGDCPRCPFYNGYGCIFRDFDEIEDCIPANWEIKD